MPAFKIPRSDIVSQDLYQSRRETEKEDDLAAQEIDCQGGNIGGHVDDLTYAVCLPDIEVDEAG